MFQDFSAPGDPVIGEAKLQRLRVHMKSAGVDVVLVPHADEQRNEYLPPNAERLAWLTGFTGSAGAVLITMNAAVLFVDGRYTLQAAEQIDNNHIEVDSLIDNPPHKWLAENAGEGWAIGIDPWLHTANEVKRLEKAAEKTEATLKLLNTNPVDAIWDDQPDPPLGPTRIHPFEFAGSTTREKMQDMDKALAENNAAACVLTDASSVSWLFNIRGADVSHTPLSLAHAILRADDLPLLFIDERKLDIETKAFLNQVCYLHAPDELKPNLFALSSGTRVMLDPDMAPHAVGEIVREAGGTVVHAPDPARLPKAIKNQVEIEGTRNAHLRDGAAMATFLAWLDQQKPGSLDEITAARKLEAIRAETGDNKPLKDISFDTISGAGPNGAIVHYRVNETTNRILESGELYLVDSGGQYEDGTTDITRTVAVGPTGSDERQAFTLVLKGHISLALARFPKGTRGVDIDVLARNALWQHGMDYAHGTGHGVGSYLAVHEGPQNISKRGMQELLPGMIVSNEPGYYREGTFGIRIENLVLVREAQDIDGGDTPMLGFETLSLAPIDLRLVDPILMTDDELHWLNAYHGWVRRELTPLVSDDVVEWLRQATEPMAKDLPAASA